ncbi:ComEC/Rec2 family competence protein [Ahrensia kielensis]|uniref:ComEC/Rec2 family competence protein n=1 Tax=Ahrensia kielensis TaxID=76980 RepID=A0ABU9T3Z2_9HYPH
MRGDLKQDKSLEPDERWLLKLDDFNHLDIPPHADIKTLEDNVVVAKTPSAKKLQKQNIQYGTLTFRQKVHEWLDTQLQIEIGQGTAFLFIPVAMIIGVTIYMALPVEPAIHNIPAALFVFAALRIVLRHAPIIMRFAMNAALIILCAMGLMQLRTQVLATPMLGSEVSTRITGQIRAIENRPNGSVRYTIDLTKTERPKLRYAPERIRLTARKPLEEAQIGEGIHGYARLRPPSGAVRPLGYDFAYYNYFSGIGANGFFLGQPKTNDLGAQYTKNTPILLVERARYWLANRIRGDNKSAVSAVSAALITGDKAAIPEETNEVLRISGLAHILSISGLHMALVAGTVMFALRAAFAFSPNWSASRPTKKYAAIAGFSAIIIYLFLAGASVATQRSFIMLAVMLGALLSDRSALTMRNLAIAAIIVILIAPEAVPGPSFQMSFAATLALIGVYAWWTSHRAGREFVESQNVAANITRTSAGFLTGLSVTSMVAGTATGIFAAYHFQRIAMLGLLGNLLAMPIVSLITMPLAIIATLLIPFGLDGYVYRAMNWSVKIVIEIAQIVSDITPDGSTGALSPAALIWLSATILMICLLRSQLRYLGLLCLIPAYMAQSTLAVPQLIISEDAKQVAIIDAEEGALKVNRKRPSAFIVEQWKAAYSAKTIKLPDKGEGSFICQSKQRCDYEGQINGQHYTVTYLTEAPDEAQWAAACKQEGIIIAAFAPFTATCENQQNIIITAQQLALNGSAEIYIRKASQTDEKKLHYQTIFAQGDAARPWQAHRKYSRSARNLGPYQRE